MSHRLALTGLVVLLATTATAQAAQTWTVTQTPDGSGTCVIAGPCSLRQAINSAVAGDTVVVPASVTPYSVASTPIAADKSLTISGAGGRSTTITSPAGATSTLIFNLGGTASTTITVSGLTITGANNHTSGGGGAFAVAAGTFVIRDVGIVGNSATATGGGITNEFGGGISMSGSPTLTIDRSLIANNTVTGTGAIGASAATLTITDSTITGNTAKSVSPAGAAYGGALSIPSGAKLTMTNVTLSGNSAAQGGNLYANVGSGGFVKFQNTIIAAGTATIGSNCSLLGSPTTSLGNNLESLNQCGLEKHDTDPLLGALGNHGGPTDTMALGAGSPALRVASGCAATDQRALARPTVCSIGAYEPQAPTLATVATPAEPAIGQDVTFAATTTDADGDTPTVSWTFDDGGTASGASVTHKFATAGPHTGTATATDPLGLNATSLTGVTVAAASLATPALDITAPVLSGLSLAPKRFRAAKSGAALAAAAGTTVSYSLGEHALTFFTVERGLPGRRMGKRCVSPKKAHNKGKRCVRYSTVPGNPVHETDKGAQHVRFTGHFGNRRLAPGSYRLTLTAHDLAGNRSVPARTTFRVVR
jgi:hypothetical protein